MLDTFDNPNTKNYYLIHFEIPEFTCLCPLTGQPDFAKFYVDYIPKKKCYISIPCATMTYFIPF